VIQRGGVRAQQDWKPQGWSHDTRWLLVPKCPCVIPFILRLGLRVLDFFHLRNRFYQIYDYSQHVLLAYGEENLCPRQVNCC
jgi:hypothetical protein